MIKPYFSLQSILITIFFFIYIHTFEGQEIYFNRDGIITLMKKVNDFQVKVNGNRISRNWKQSTYYIGVMAFYRVTGDSSLIQQAVSWAENNQWKVGNEMFFPPNRLACTQTYLELYFIKKDAAMIKNTRDYLDAELVLTEPAYLRGWYYIDALFVGIPSFAMMSKATGQEKYLVFMNRVFREVTEQLYDQYDDLFYRDSEAHYNETSANGKKVLWSRGNGWAIAAIPRILEYLPPDDPDYPLYAELLTKMANSLSQRQGEDGLWRSNLADEDEYPMPESSGTAFFIYALAWGINHGILDKNLFEPVINKGWEGLCKIVSDEGKVCWGQPEARKPGKVKKDDSDEFVTGAFLLAGSEMIKLADKQKEKSIKE